MLLIFLQFLTCSLYTLHHINFQLLSSLIENTKLSTHYSVCFPTNVIPPNPMPNFISIYPSPQILSSHLLLLSLHKNFLCCHLWSHAGNIAAIPISLSNHQIQSLFLYDFSFFNPFSVRSPISNTKQAPRIWSKHWKVWTCFSISYMIWFCFNLLLLNALFVHVQKLGFVLWLSCSLFAIEFVRFMLDFNFLFVWIFRENRS